MRICEKCGATVFADSPRGLCSVCLFRTGLGSFEEESNARGESVRMQLEFGDYELLEELGRGGQGVVYRARQKSLNRTVALKVIGLGQWSSTPHLKRFRHEAEAAARLEHPQIVPIHEIGERDGCCYFSMKFVEGARLDEVVQREPMSPRRAAELLVKIARTVQFAHEHGILHRDIKPGNILLDRQGEPHLTDFGLARLLEQESTITNSFDVLGTPSYMPPEQAAGRIKELTAASDVYSLGAVFYQMLTGEAPFTGGTTYETIRKVLEMEPRNPRIWNPKVDVDLATICLKCLEKDPKRRYETAAALADDVKRWLRHEPIQARRTGIARRGGKWIRRKPMAAALILSLAAIAALALVDFWNRQPTSPPSGIAVLPFANLSADKDNAYFADAIQDEILTRLSKIADLKVIARTSTERYRTRPENLLTIARQLGVAHLVEGSVQKSGNAVRVNVQLIKAVNNSHLWADTFDRKLTDILSVESEVAKAIADQLRVQLTGREEAAVAAKPTDNAEAYDAYLRGLAYTLKFRDIPANALGAQKYLSEAVRLDPKFALAWALLSYVDAHAYIVGNLQPTPALREEARQAAEMALTLQPNLGEALHAEGFYHYACLRDYDTALAYFERARLLLPNNSKILESLAYVSRRRGEWKRADSYFTEAERLDPRNIELLQGHESSYVQLHRFPEALRKLDQILDLAPDEIEILAQKARIAQAEGDLPRAAAILAPLQPTADDTWALEIETYQAILERQPMRVLPRLKEILSTPHPSLGFYESELRYFLGRAQNAAGDRMGARETWQQARRELEAFFQKQSENYLVVWDLAFVDTALGNYSAGLAMAERAVAANPIEKDPVTGFCSLETFAQVASQIGDHDRALSALKKLCSLPGNGPFDLSMPLTAAILQLDPIWDPLRGDPRFEKIIEQAKQPLALK
jgi:serine/threonine protein kinase/Tfp pilus assembly protein PilF